MSRLLPPRCPLVLPVTLVLSAAPRPSPHSVLLPYPLLGSKQRDISGYANSSTPGLPRLCSPSSASSPVLRSHLMYSPTTSQHRVSALDCSLAPAVSTRSCTHSGKSCSGTLYLRDANGVTPPVLRK
ncbi:hypothetical protein GY45DRAFT_500122 [Cubamyces sp. BRFM 1775]|nr:hypothetical protein GY45DRAFT_500122 [Cubamyces sp. BRFM 1775]